MRLSSTTHDPKIDRIEASWFDPGHRDAHWLATVADEVTSGPTRSGPVGRFVYVSLSPERGSAQDSVSAQDSGSTQDTMLVIDRNTFAEVVRRIPALRPLGSSTVALAA